MPGSSEGLTSAGGSAFKETVGHSHGGWQEVSHSFSKRLLEYLHDLTANFFQNELTKKRQVRSHTIFFEPRFMLYTNISNHPSSFTGQLHAVLEGTVERHAYQEAGTTGNIMEAGYHSLFAFGKLMSHLGKLPQSTYWLTWKTARYKWILL